MTKAYKVPIAVHLNLAISEGHTENGTKTSYKEALGRYYRLIADCLNISEAGCIQAGVPWLPPTRGTRELSGKFQGPLPEFVRLSLVGVNTTVLELYCDDLENLAPTSKNLSRLFIRRLSAVERYAMSFFLFFAVLCLSLLATNWLNFAPSARVSVSIVLAGLAFISGIFLSSDAQRRASFHCLLYNELLRRRGLDQINSNRLRIFPVETRPIPK